MLVLIFLCSPTLVLPQASARWRLKNRLQTSLEYDDNIREATSSGDTLISDSSLRFLFQSSASYLSKLSSLQFSYKGGLQRYFNNPIENKLINDIDASGTRRFGRFVLGLRASGRLKLYLNNNIDYGSGFVEFFLQPPGAGGFNTEIALAKGGLDYQEFNDFDTSDYKISWTISRRLSPRVTLKLKPAYTFRKYPQRNLIILNGTDLVLVLNQRQHDREYQAYAQVLYSKSILLQLSYLFEYNNSNNELFIFHKHQLTLILGIPFPGRIWLRGYAALQQKKYANESPDLPVEADPERTQSNFFIIDLSKDFTASLTALARFAYHNNESILRDRFYSKNLLTLGMDFRF